MSFQTKPNAIPTASTRFTAALERRVLHHIRKHKILAEGERLIVAVSGGPDSTALLTILSRLAPKLHLDITIAHFNHRLRTPEETAADLDYVRSLAALLELPLAHGTADVRAHARQRHLSLEDAARRLRYAFLAERTTAASAVALGHTLDDQAETVLLHLIRGAGLTGLSAMKPRSPWPFGDGPGLARPLLSLRRADTERYCHEIGLQPRIDPTNEALTTTRNQVRHEVLPVLRRLNPQIEDALARLAESAADDSGHLDVLAATAFAEIAEVTETTVVLDRHELTAMPPALASRALRLAFAELCGSASDLEFAHIDAITSALRGPPGAHSLPGGISATLDQTSLTLSRGPLRIGDPFAEVSLAVPGHTTAGSWLIETSLEPPPATPATHNPLEAYLDADKTGPTLTVRSRRPGDRLRPIGLGGEKKLQDILVDAKVPARDRDAIPLICVGDQIAWVVGHCIDERFAITAATKQALHFVASKRE